MDPGSITGIGLAIVPLAVQSIKSLKNTVTRYKGRDKTLARLYHVLEDLDNILEVLERAVESEASTRALLEGPVSRCNLLCREFETAMQAFGEKSKLGFRDWTKMEFMTGDINEFMDRLAGYKATISVGLGIVTMQTSKLSHKVLEEYNEVIQDTIYNLNINLQRLDEKMELLVQESKSTNASDTSTDLRDERVVTEQCLRICQDASSYIESLAEREESLKDQLSSAPNAESQGPFEAQLLIRRTLNESRDSLAQTIGRLQERLESMATSGTPKSDPRYLQLKGDLQTSEQCLELCKTASDQVANQKVYTVGEMVADGDSDQVVITTLADLFDVRKASSTNRSAQWIGSLSDETARQVSKDRYSSRFGAVATNGAGDGISTMSSVSNTREVNSSLAARQGKAGQPAAPETVHRRPSPNEMRKRATEDGVEKEERQ
ncbi:hypothetical protein FOVG_18081 [Fusarium oxysporum f. sp. pisi HDV247]|uniref:Azaphilone pigments biosynthesis cluster protein L N-terminal domain-containing protein n=1 Tax=Fusarium oxysporum f. sp. pisi HDV247 TaxID=1080344 RepID=W9NKL3_FUSOX|nr:hypothetical protein FOVG_18081 [Fusarium oxysporum f. sp. pisi HDV247]